MNVAAEPEEPSSGKPSPLLPIVLVIVLAGAWLGGYVWWNNRTFSYTSPDGFTVVLPDGWTAVTGKGNVMTARGALPGGGNGTAEARLLPHGGKAPHDGLANRGPDEYSETEIDGKVAGIAVYDDGERRCLEVVVTGKRYLRFTLCCDRKIFDEHRHRFERCARSIRWKE